MSKLLYATLLSFLAISYCCAHVTKPLTSQTIPAYNIADYNKKFATFYNTLPTRHNTTIGDRIAAASHYFMGVKYQLGPLGEGPDARFNQNPLYRSDAFDCVTFVSTVLALANSDDLQSFKHHLLKIRYADSHPRFMSRNHFMSIDWNKNNSFNGYVRDITYKITDAAGKPIAQAANTIIDKPNWYKKTAASQIRSLHAINNEQRKQLMTEFQQQANQTQQEKSILLYLPLKRLFNKNGNAIQSIFDQIPNGAIIEIVRPNWNIKKLVGTNINVSHLGFAVRTEQSLMYREASLLEKKVIDVPLSQYLKNYLSSPTIKGINVQQPVNQSSA